MTLTLKMKTMMNSVLLKVKMLHDSGFLVKLSLSMLIVCGWIVVLWKSLCPIVSIIAITHRYNDEKLQQQQQQQQQELQTFSNQTTDDHHYDIEDVVDSDYKLVKLEEIKESVLILSACFIMFTTIISILGLIGVIWDRISLLCMYGIFILMALMFTITQGIQDPIAWVDNSGGCVGFLLLLLINMSIWTHIRMVFWKRQPSNPIDHGVDSINRSPISPSSFQNDNFEANSAKILIE